MLVILTGVSTLASVLKLIVLLIVFFALLFGAHLFTKWYAKSNYASTGSPNISVLESRRIAPGKDIVIARVGETYVAFVMFKENAVFLTKLDEDELTFSPPQMQNLSFRDVLKKMKRNAGDGTDNENKE